MTYASNPTANINCALEAEINRINSAPKGMFDTAKFRIKAAISPKAVHKIHHAMKRRGVVERVLCYRMKTCVVCYKSIMRDQKIPT